MKPFKEKKKKEREKTKTDYRESQGRKLRKERAEAAQVAEAERAAQGRFAEPSFARAEPSFAVARAEPSFARAEPSFAVARAEPSFARAEPSFAVAEPSFAVAERKCPTDIPRCQVVESGNLHINRGKPIEARVVKMPKKLTYFDSDDSDDSDMSIDSNSNSTKKTSSVKLLSEITRDILDRKIVKTRVKDLKTLKQAITDTKGVRKFCGLDTEDNPDCTVCSFYLYSKLLETSPDNTNGFRAMRSDKFNEYSSYCRDHTSGGVSKTEIQNLLKDNGLTNMGIHMFRVESDNGIRVLLSELLEPGEITFLYLPGHVVLVYAHHFDSNYYIIDIQQENPLQIALLSDYKISKDNEYENGGFIGLMIKDEKKIKRTMKRLTSQSGKQHEKSAGVNKDASVEYSEYIREKEPTSPVSIRKPKQDDSVNPRKRPRTLGGSRTLGGGRKTRKTRK